MQVDTKPASDVIAGAMARAASQGTIHPLDTLKVQLQSGKGRGVKPALSKISQLVPPQGELQPTTVMTLEPAPRSTVGLQGRVYWTAGAALFEQRMRIQTVTVESLLMFHVLPGD